ncbi:hypothetical protein [Paenibacillus sp. FSL R7-0273]|uniref:hypothetical protein n=1 Tax=Paenibacillus sp. FSL R7-0273 TaxID=1536772 RepID=UPI000A4AE27F|nr:hypothetical protein [Paenibacillus sp. FSL R7-0273]
MKSVSMQRIKKAINAILVFLGIFSGLSYILREVIFGNISSFGAVTNVVQMASLGIIILLSLLFTAWVINERN